MATQMLNDGVSIAVVVSRLAHARASTTLNVYAHAAGGDVMRSDWSRGWSMAYEWMRVEVEMQALLLAQSFDKSAWSCVTTSIGSGDSWIAKVGEHP